jgi:hypothetical protein
LAISSPVGGVNLTENGEQPGSLANLFHGGSEFGISSILNVVSSELGSVGD